jgi:hypothetical protein
MGAAGGITQALAFIPNMYGQGGAIAGQMQEHDFAQKTAGQNAGMAESAAKTAYERGAQQEMQSRMKYGAQRGDQAAAFGASGVAVGSGSAIDVLANTDALSDYDAKVIRNNAAREAWGYSTQAKTFRDTEKRLKGSRNDVLTNSLLKAGGSFLGSMGSMAGSGGK